MKNEICLICVTAAGNTCGSSSAHINQGDTFTVTSVEELISTDEGIFCGCVCVRLLRRMYLSMYWGSFTHLQLMRGWNR